MRIKSLLFLPLFGIILFVCATINREQTDKLKMKKDMKLKISFGDTELTATLYDNPSSRDLIAQLPITTELEDYASNEKIFYPEQKLSKEGAPKGYEPSKGDITYYAPWGDVAIFYKDFSYSPGLISLGKIDDNGIEQLKKVGNTPVTFELIDQ